jgi:enoyl-CoA hydratase
MSDLTLERHGRVAELSLSRNSLNTLSPIFVAEIDRVLDELADDDTVGALVLGSASSKFFSAGWDLPELLELDAEGFLAFYRRFNSMSAKLAGLALPSVAAMAGHAVAGGAILALACDWRVMTSGKAKFGLNEVDLGVPMPLPATLLAREVGGWRGGRDMLVAGRLFSPLEALEAGLVDVTVEGENVRDEALERAEGLAAKPAGAAGGMKSALRGAFFEACEAGRLDDEARFREAFFNPGTRELLTAAAEKLVPR